MRALKRAVGLMAFALIVGVSAGAQADRPVVVELFTSQGCNSCPPAEAFMRDLIKMDDVIALEYHVDYWDYIGWEDPFASPRYTSRQRAYAESLGQRYVYTPQMVIDGRRHEVGSRREDVKMAIMMARQKDGRAAPDVSLTHTDEGVQMRLSHGAVPAGGYDVVVVSFDAAQETRVTRGENRGKTLTNVRVVRSLETLTAWTGGDYTKTVALDALPGDGGCAVLVQERGGRIVAAAQVLFDGK